MQQTLVTKRHSRIHSLSPCIFFFPLVTEIQTSTMMTTTRSTTITASAPSPTARYTIQETPPRQVVTFEGGVELALGTLGVWTSLVVTEGEEVLLGTLGVGSEVALAKPVHGIALRKQSKYWCTCNLYYTSL